MIPKKLFTPKCLHTDREVVFHEDLENFYNYTLSKLSKIQFEQSNQNSTTMNFIFDENTILNSEEIFTYKFFKSLWKEKKMSMFHFSKSKEENPKEYYEVLFGEIQLFFLSENKNFSLLHKLLSIFTLYSLYYTQITDFFYQINTTPEILQEVNNCIILLRDKYNNIRLVKEITGMVSKLYQDDALSIGVLIGLKTIILNKYGLPMEQKQKVYKEYSDISDSLKVLDRNKKEQRERKNLYRQNLDEYTDLKRETLNIIKEIKEDNLESLYCEFMNLQLYNIKAEDTGKNNEAPMTNFELLEIKKEDLQVGRITNLDLQFNQVDNNIFNNY